MSVELQKSKPPARPFRLGAKATSELKMVLESDFAKYLPETTRRKLSQALSDKAGETSV